jgi:hypothetical protein
VSRDDRHANLPSGPPARATARTRVRRIITRSCSFSTKQPARNYRDVVALLQDASQTLLAAVEKDLNALDCADSGVPQLARRYAQLIDMQEDPKLQAWAYRWIGPLLLTALVELGATPLARAKLKKGSDDAAEDPLDRLPVRRRGA